MVILLMKSEREGVAPPNRKQNPLWEVWDSFISRRPFLSSKRNPSIRTQRKWGQMANCGVY